MQTFPLAWAQGQQGRVLERVGDHGFMPDLPPPCFSLRGRREVSAPDQQNSRLVEHWQTDSPALTNTRRDIAGTSRYMDMNPTPSRLYREDMRQSQPYVVSRDNPLEQEEVNKINAQIQKVLAEIQSLGTQLAGTTNPSLTQSIRGQIDIKQQLYKVLFEKKQLLAVDAIGRNPYFEKYDVASDPRNIIRELRTAVTEDVEDRGVAESERMMRRGMQNRWTPPAFADSMHLNSLTAYELMKPKMNEQEKLYRDI